jgi:hypothetical protein
MWRDALELPIRAIESLPTPSKRADTSQAAEAIANLYIQALADVMDATGTKRIIISPEARQEVALKLTIAGSKFISCTGNLATLGKMLDEGWSTLSCLYRETLKSIPDWSGK